MDKFPNKFDWFMIKYGLYLSIFNLGVGIGAGYWVIALMGVLGIALYPFITKKYKESERIDEAANSR